MRAPFPHVERAIIVPRPALVLAVLPTDAIGDLLWVAMITNAQRPEWRGDVHIADAPDRGQIVPSKVRTAKIATIAADAVLTLGVADAETIKTVRSIVTRTFGAS